MTRSRTPIATLLAASAFALGVALFLAACGRGEKPADPAKESPARTTVRCPVSGTPFRPGTGRIADAGGRRVEVCSEGCRFRFELEPESFPADDRDR